MTFGAAERGAYHLLSSDREHPLPMLSNLLVLLVLGANLLFSGFISGWASMQLFLIDEDQYHDRCESPSVRCAAQESQLALIYGLAQFTTTLSSFPAGLFLDKAGPVATSLVAGAFSAVGFALMAVSDSVTFDAFIEGYCLIGVGGTLTLLTSFQAGFVHLPWQTLVLAAANCLFDASAVMPSVLYALHTALGLSRQTLLLVYAGLALAVYPLVAICWHLHRGTKEVKEEKRLAISWTTQLISLPFGFLAVFASVHNLQSAIFFGTVNRMLAVDGDQRLVYTRAFGWVLPVGFLAVPLLHAVVRKYSVLGAMFSTSLLCVGYHAFLLVPSLELQPITFVLFTIFRGFLYSTVAAFGAETFGEASLGSLLGALYSLCALVALCQVPIVVAANAAPRWAQHMYIVSLATAVCMLGVLECYRRYHSVRPVTTESEGTRDLPTSRLLSS
ncbi:hypothetical protein SDRG_06152 [Saprolegnia diclina VS20]|uniref:Major facilitator superfamily (MFS) profile domain-containing protein n=1 Tax=Saprolegnia diclina (strain VS20) TaxID=1156394 RepID=T0S1W2_SAPDV|nr:hypothetical protein SDRG_06152 [Saprolegnia diclina VS20]EQC36717.1 hypothetical protein SDRG_06152 [Saprolegnia diclina VS20]|eukprot:XP_008610138.1 hypothetical protein SDRG_06152 [Saprolegnia diclina VS20]